MLKMSQEQEKEFLELGTYVNEEAFTGDDWDGTDWANDETGRETLTIFTGSEDLEWTT